MKLFNKIGHYASLPLKIFAIFMLAQWHKAYLFLKYPYKGLGRRPNKDSLLVGYNASKLMLKKHLMNTHLGYPALQLNTAHQALRHGSLAWSVPTQEIVGGLENYLKDGKAIRGVGNVSESVPAMGMSIAHGMTTALKNNVTVPTSLRQKFVEYVDNEIKQDFSEARDTNTTPRLLSTAFDAIYALSLLYTAHSLTKDKKYLDAANTILYKKLYILLLLAPLTYVSEKRRYFFIDHISLFGLRTIYLNDPIKPVKWVIKHAIKFIHSQSYVYGNPYTAALAYECGALPENQRAFVLDLHHNTNILRANKHRTVLYTSQYPSDYSTHTADEFLLDEIQSLGVDLEDNIKQEVPLNGLCLAKSLLILME